MYYAERIQPVVAERLKSLASTGVAVTASARLDIIKNITRDIFEDESEEVKMEIEKQIAAAQPQASSSTDKVEGAIRSPNEYQKSVLYLCC